MPIFIKRALNYGRAEGSTIIIENLPILSFFLSGLECISWILRCLVIQDMITISKIIKILKGI